jgi:WD40 repeat protein
MLSTPSPEALMRAILLLAPWLVACTAVPPRTAPPAPTADTVDTVEAAVQQLPSTDVFLVPIEGAGEHVRAGTPRNLTRRSGYDNQPAFTPDGAAILYTSIRDDGQADIYRYDLGRQRATRLTATPESEYSPTPLPTGNGFSVVRVERDGTQRLWSFDWRGANPRLLLEDIRPVGYHAWADSTTLGLFVLGEPHTLQIADLRRGTAVVAASDIGRALHRVPGRGSISFVEKLQPGDWWITEIDPRTRQIEQLARTRDGVEDYAWLPDGSLLMGEGSVLYRWTRESGRWTPIADFADAGLRGISRLAVSPDGRHLALVAVVP